MPALSSVQVLTPSLRRTLLAGVAPAALLAASAPSAGAANTFSATGSMAESRYWPAWSVLADGKVLVAGGSVTGGGSPTLRSSSEIFNPATGTWSSTGSLATARFKPGFATLPDGKVLVAGGNISFSSYTPTATAEIYDPATGTWSAASSMSTPRADFEMVELSDGKILAGGGSTAAGTYTATAEIYDPASGTWSATGSLTATAGYARFARLTTGKILAIGVGGSPVTAQGANLYDPAAGTWSAVGSYSGAGRQDGAFVALPGGKALLAGGFASSSAVASAETFDSGSGTWSATGSLSTARAVPAATLMANGNVLVAGGDDGTSSASTILESAEVYDPSAGTFSTVGSMATSRAAAVAIPLQSGSILIPGGVSDSGGSISTTNTAEIFLATLPVAALSPESADFGTRQINTGASEAKTFTLSSSGDSAVVIGSAGASVTGTAASQFAVSGGTCTAGASVAVGSSCTVEVTFNPTASGAKAASLSVPTNVGAKTAALAGTGVAGGSVKVGSLGYSATQIRTLVRVSGSGRISQRGTRNAGRTSAAKTVSACTASSVNAKKAGVYKLTCKLTKSTRKARRSGPVRVRLVTSFTPTGGTATSATKTVTLRSLKPRYTG